MKFLNSLKNKNLSKETCLLRVDFNISEKDNNNPRLETALPTLKFLIEKKSKIVILSHRGSFGKRLSLRPFADIVSKKLKQKINFISHFNFLKISDDIKKSKPGSVFLLENLRFLPAEEKDDEKFAKQLASLGTFYINDAFGVCHRKNASISKIIKFLPSYAGLQLEKEIKNLSSVMKNAKKPLVIILPIDYKIENKQILDIGPNTAKYYSDIIKKSKTIAWNGPMGYFENKRFAKGSEAVVKAIINNKKAFSIVGGGETSAIFQMAKIKNNVFISTGGGAMLKYLAKEKMPGI